MLQSDANLPQRWTRQLETDASSDAPWYRGWKPRWFVFWTTQIHTCDGHRCSAVLFNTALQNVGGLGWHGGSFASGVLQVWHYFAFIIISMLGNRATVHAV